MTIPTRNAAELQQIVDAIHQRNRFVICSHSRPDGDAVGSQLAMAYALEALGKEEALHSAVFSEMHDKKNFMFMQGNEKETLAAQVAFVKAHGISESDYTNAYNSFTVQTDMSKADDLVHRYHVDGVPLLVVNGKYVVDVNMAGSQANVMSIVNDLIASEKSH
jgi:thiol:disulfide interchange protein DsbA